MAEAAVVVNQDSTMAVLRQAGVLIAIAASVAVGMYVVMWAKTPNYTLLYSDLSDRDVAQMAEALKNTDVQYRVDPDSGAILVAASHVHDARLKLAAAGLPKSSAMGFEMMNEDKGFGTSQFLERARYQRAIEGELSRSISRINNVRSARVHLGMPRETVFSRSQKIPTASVIIDLYAGRTLEQHQVSAITHLVSASVPNLPAQKVTIVDQQGNLLTDQGGDADVALTGRRFDHRQRVEQAYIQRIEAILMPFVGADGVRAQVTADMDFTATEQTRESFNPDLPAIRSERLLEEQKIGAGNAGGVPGALTNEPAGEATAPEEIVADAGSDSDGAASITPESSRTQTTRNYELDRTISHTKPSVGTIRRLSVAVVLRAPPSSEPSAAAEETQGQGEEASEATAADSGFSDAQIEKMTALVKEAIGFDPTRGDTVNLTSAEFIVPPIPAALPEPPIWQQPWIWDVAKQVAGALFVLFLVLGVIRPAMKSLMNKSEAAGGQIAVTADGTLMALPDGTTQAALPPGTSEEEETTMIKGPELPRDVDGVRQYVNKEPKIAAQVVRGWVGDD